MIHCLHFPFPDPFAQPFCTLNTNPSKSYIDQQHFFCVPLLQCLLLRYHFHVLSSTLALLLSSLKCQGGVAKLGNWHVCNDWHHCSSVVLSKYCGLSIIIKQSTNWISCTKVWILYTLLETSVLIWKSFWMGRVSLCQSNILIASCTNTGELRDMQFVKDLTRNAKNKKSYVECTLNFNKISSITSFHFYRYL